MRVKIFMTAFVLAGLLNASAWAAEPETVPDRLEVAVTYNALYANLVAGRNFWLSGGSAQGGYRFAPHWSAVADLAGQHSGNIASTGVGLDLVTLTFGPQYTLRVHRAFVFGQARVGVVWGSNSLFPNGASSANSAAGTAVALGGGVDLPLTRRFSIRALQAEWSRTQLDNLNANAQNSLRLSTGIVFRLR